MLPLRSVRTWPTDHPGADASRPPAGCGQGIARALGRSMMPTPPLTNPYFADTQSARESGHQAVCCVRLSPAAALEGVTYVQRWLVERCSFSSLSVARSALVVRDGRDDRSRGLTAAQGRRIADLRLEIALCRHRCDGAGGVHTDAKRAAPSGACALSTEFGDQRRGFRFFEHRGELRLIDDLLFDEPARQRAKRLLVLRECRARPFVRGLEQCPHLDVDGPRGLVTVLPFADVCIVQKERTPRLLVRREPQRPPCRSASPFRGRGQWRAGDRRARPWRRRRTRTPRCAPRLRRDQRWDRA